MAREHSFASKVNAKAERGHWKKMHPKVLSVYVPSGRLPRAALAWMAGAALLGLPAAAVVGVVAGAVGIAISLGVAVLFDALTETTHVFLVFYGLLAIAIVPSVFFLMYVAVGVAATQMVILAGKRTKNRNTAAAFTLSIAAAFGAVIPVQLATRYSLRLVEGYDTIDSFTSIFGTGGIGMFCLALGCLTAVVTAGVISSRAVKEAKFCENCELYMESYLPMLLSFSAITEVSNGLSSRNTAATAAALVPVCEGEEEASLKLFRCPHCRAGYAEIKIIFCARWPRKKNPRQSERMKTTWLAVSEALLAADVDRLAKGDVCKTARGL
jgi:hypothetical protein